MTTLGMAPFTRRALLARILCTFALTLWARPALAQTCFDYVDGCDHPGWDLPSPLPNCQNALAPIRCVEQGDLATACSWNGSCHTDGDASDCCTAIPAPSGTVQSNLEMHTLWHQCFGNVGNRRGNNPPGRGARWYAFHRQFEFDFNRWRDEAGFGPIQAVEWCPNMELEIGHTSGGWPASGAGSHPASCGTGPDRPYTEGDGTAPDCPTCIALPQCLFHTVGGSPGGPAACPSAPSTLCGVPDGGDADSLPDLDLGYDSLDDFPNVEEVTTVLDAFFHGQMHGAVGLADRGSATCDPSDSGVTDTCYVLDVIASNCSPRDPMFWRLHRALDDVVRAWQDRKPVDVVVVVDRSGSMSDPAVGGGTKLAAALEALDMFAALLDDCDDDPSAPAACDESANRIGVTSYSGNVSAQLELTPADGNLRAAGGPIPTAISAIQALGPNGCTGIGLGLTEAIGCLAGDCPSLGGSAAGSANTRKAVLLLTDGIENVPVCLDPAGASGPTCGSSCFGAAFDYASMADTQLAAVGFGQSGSLDGDLLTLLAERQGGIYMQNPNLATNDDLKEFFTKAFGQLTDEFLVTDPRGVLAAAEAATAPVEYTSCSDDKLTFAAGWQGAPAPSGLSGLRLLVNSPSGDLLRAGEAGIERGADATWDFTRVTLPHEGEGHGAWRAQLVRPHRAYVNGFATDAFTDPEAGAAIVRRQIQRLCPDGCERTLYFEDGRLGDPSVYAMAVKAEQASGLLRQVDRPRSGGQFFAALRRGRYDLVVFAHMGPDRAERYDAALGARLCENQRAIVTDTRKSAAGRLRCMGALLDGSVNWNAMTGDGRLFDGTLELRNPGYDVVTYGFQPQTTPQATANSGKSGAVMARSGPGKAEPWFLDVLGRGLSRLEVHNPTLTRRTDKTLVASARVLPSFVPSGGWDQVAARVEVEYPKIGLGTLLARRGLGEAVRIGGETLDPRAAALRGLEVPTGTAEFPLYDDGTHGDQEDRNFYWSAELTGLGTTDGMYRLRFIFDFTKDGCTTRRELAQSVYVEVAVDQESSKPQVVARVPLPNGGWRTTLALRPADRHGNAWGPGRDAGAACVKGAGCKIAPEVEDDHRGGYRLTIDTEPATAAARFSAFGAAFHLPLPCERCPRLESIALGAAQAVEHGVLEGRIVLGGPAPAGGAAVALGVSDHTVAWAPPEVVIPAGKTGALFELRLLHAHAGPAHIELVARYGGDLRAAKLVVLPKPVRTDVPPPVVDPAYMMHGEHGAVRE